MEDNAQHKKQQQQCFFAPVQARKKLWSYCGGQLCPSMDVVVLWTTSPTSSSLVLHRTVSWQRLASFVVTTTTTSKEEQDQQQQQFVAWSPDGRAMAVVTDDDGSNSNTVALYHMEAMLADAADSTTTNHGRIHTLPIISDEGRSIIIINGLTWAHVGRPHSQWSLSEQEMEQEESWSYRSHYLDRCSTFLPPRSSSNTTDHHHVHEEELLQQDSATTTSNTLLPSSTTPLSLLCVATVNHGIHLYLYGRYHIATLIMPSQQHDDDETSSSSSTTTTMVCSSNLEHLLVLRRRTNNNHVNDDQQQQLSLYSMTFFQHHGSLQTMASLYCSITADLEKIQRYTQEIMASWKAALGPLDVKLEGLVRLLKNYNVKEQLSSILLNYLFMGHTTMDDDDNNSNNVVSNVMDQFFTSIPMNDQLLQRLEKSTTHAVAQVETMTRCQLWKPAQSLVYHVNELLHSQQCQEEALFFVKEEESTLQLLSTSCQVLLVTVSKFISQIVEARFRLRDLILWLQSVGSQIKARGTPANSSLRENAKKRRVSNQTLQNMTTYLNQQHHNHNNNTTAGVTETLLGLPISDFLTTTTTEDHVVVMSCQDCPLSSPKSQQDEKNATTTTTMKTPTIPYATTRVAELVQQVFDQPHRMLSQSVQRTDLLLDESSSSNDDDTTIAIHTRIGIDCNNNHDYYYYNHDDDIIMMEKDKKPQQQQDNNGFFRPCIFVGSDDDDEQSSSFSYSRHWAIVAKTKRKMTTQQNNDFLQLFALPMGQRRRQQHNDDIDYSDDLEDATTTSSSTIPYYLVSRIVLPPHCHVKEVAFYGDDGKSSLSSGEDSGTGQEGRQAIGMLLDRGDEDEVMCHSQLGKNKDGRQQHTSIVSEELWLFRYDDLLFQPVELADEQDDDSSNTSRIVLQETNIGKECTTYVHPILEKNHEEQHVKQDNILFAKTRQLRMHDEVTNTSLSSSEEAEVMLSSSSASRLMLSGSRGIGGIFTTTNGCSTTTLDLFDLEEDEEESDDEEEQLEEE